MNQPKHPGALGMARTLAGIAVTLAAMLPLQRSLAADPPAAAPSIDDDGVAHVGALDVPASIYLSPEAHTRFIERFAHPVAGPAEDAPVQEIRDFDERINAPYVSRGEVLYPVDLHERVIGGVRTLVVTPRAGVAPRNRHRVLINLHGGGFKWGEGNGAKTESIPIAGTGRITVITVAYRMAPEYKFPAASEDVTAVYRALLKEYRPEDIGIYGCSAGGILASESIAWFQREHLPIPGAIGAFCGFGMGIGGDAAHTGPALMGSGPFKGADSGDLSSGDYFKDVPASDVLAYPILSESVLRGFPPTLLIAGSRDFTASSLYRAQQALTNAGVEAELHIWDGMWHAFFFDPDLPESKEVYQVVTRFFDRHLGHRRQGAAAQLAR